MTTCPRTSPYHSSRTTVAPPATNSGTFLPDQSGALGHVPGAWTGHPDIDMHTVLGVLALWHPRDEPRTGQPGFGARLAADPKRAAATWVDYFILSGSTARGRDHTPGQRADVL